jgi:hypothetical protein
MRKCIFCDGVPVTREHVIAERLTKRMGRSQFAVIPGRTTQAEGTKARERVLLHALTVKSVCATCNNGWMNDLEAWFERRLGFLIEPVWPKLADEMISTVASQGRSLALWMLKSAAMFDQSSLLKSNRPATP